MGLTPPGLRSKPSEEALVSFDSLMPTPEKKPGIIKRAFGIPRRIFRIVKWPVRLIVGILRLPLRLFGRKRRRSNPSA